LKRSGARRLKRVAGSLLGDKQWQRQGNAVSLIITTSMSPLLDRSRLSLRYRTEITGNGPVEGGDDGGAR